MQSALPLLIFLLIQLPYYFTVGSHVNLTATENYLWSPPVLECGASSLSMNFSTDFSFEGVVFVKGHYGDLNCRTVASVEDNTKILLSLEFDKCGLVKRRSSSPNGLFISTSVVLSFHPNYVTKADKLFWIQCFYMQAEKVITTRLEVNMTATRLTEAVPMPICKYQLLADGPKGAPLTHAVVGQPIYHKWSCEPEPQNRGFYCMLVHSCYVNNNDNDTVELIDQSGCAIDKYLINNLEYTADLTAGQEAHVFKYADISQLFFQCQILISVKEPNGDCIKPICPNLIRGKRSVENEDIPVQDDPYANQWCFGLEMSIVLWTTFGVSFCTMIASIATFLHYFLKLRK